MKNLILVLFAIVTFSFIGNAQDLSFQTFNQTIEPQGELFATTEDSNHKYFIYNDWEKYSITQMIFQYSPSDEKVVRVLKVKIAYDDLDLKSSYVGYNGGWQLSTANGSLKNGRYSLYVEYKSDEYRETHISGPELKAKTEKEAASLLEQLKEKAFDMSLELETPDIERLGKKEETIFNEANPDGISYTEFQNAGASTSSSESSSSSDEAEESSTTSNSSSNTTKPKVKTEVSLRLYNKSEKLIDIKYEERGAGASKVATSISRRSTRRVTMKIGGRVFGASGNVLLVVTADMEDTEQVIAQ